MAERTCSLDGCDRAHKSRGWCHKHYRRWLQYGDPRHPVRLRGIQPADGFCTVGGCTRQSRTRGWCPAHYSRWLAHGDPLASAPPRWPPVKDRFWSKVDRNGPLPAAVPHLGPCWLWTAGVDGGGYGQFAPNARSTVRSHRYAYELLVGPIPKDLVLDHLCGIRRCVNPGHLEPVTNAVNAGRRVMPRGRSVRVLLGEATAVLLDASAVLANDPTGEAISAWLDEHSNLLERTG